MYKEIFIDDNRGSFSLDSFLVKYKEYSIGYFKIIVTLNQGEHIDYFKKSDNKFTAELIRKKSPAKAVETYYILNGELHYEDGPAFVHKEYNGSRIECGKEQYFKYGLMHRADGPAESEYTFNKKKKIPISEKYFMNGKLHRIGGPADICYEDGSITYCNFHKDGKLHNENGPAKYYHGYGVPSYSFALDDKILLYEDYLKKIKTKLYW